MPAAERGPLRDARRRSQGLAAIDLVAAAGVKPGASRAGEGAAHRALVLRARDDPTQAPVGVEHLNPKVAGDPVAARRVRGQAVAAAVVLSDGRPQLHVLFTTTQGTVVRDEEAP